MITGKRPLYMTIALLAAAAVNAQADDTAAPADGVTIGLGGQYAPRYSGSNQQSWQWVPLLQARKGAFFVDSQKGLGYDLQSANGIYLEHTLGYDLGRAEHNSAWRNGGNNLRRMGSIRATMNTAVAIGWSVTPWLSFEGKGTFPLTASQGASYQTSVTLIPLQDAQDTLAFQSAALFGDGRYMNTFYGVSRQQSLDSAYGSYRASAGFYAIDNSLTWSHQFDAHWGMVLSAGYRWLADNAADSPIVLQRNEGSAAAIVSWTF